MQAPKGAVDGRDSPPIDIERGELWQGRTILVRLTAHRKVQLMRIFAAQAGGGAQPVQTGRRTYAATPGRRQNARLMLQDHASAPQNRR